MCNVFSHWLRPCSAIDRTWTLYNHCTLDYLVIPGGSRRLVDTEPGCYIPSMASLSPPAVVWGRVRVVPLNYPPQFSCDLGCIETTNLYVACVVWQTGNCSARQQTHHQGTKDVYQSVSFFLTIYLTLRPGDVYRPVLTRSLLVWIMAWHCKDGKPLPETMMILLRFTNWTDITAKTHKASKPRDWML